MFFVWQVNTSQRPIFNKICQAWNVIEQKYKMMIDVVYVYGWYARTRENNRNVLN